VIGPPRGDAYPKMDTPDALRRHLDALTDYLEIPGADLHAMLEVLNDDITEAVPSFLGLTASITAGGIGTTLTTLDPQRARTAKASVLLPLHQITAAAPGDNMILYAAQPGAFTTLATATREAFNLDGHVILDQHLPTTSDTVTRQDVIDTQDPQLINIAIGVLIDQGHPPENAHQELTRRATHHNNNLTAAAKELLDQF